MTEYSGVDFHSGYVEEFARQYRESAAFRERFALWSALIARYAAPDHDAIDVGCGVGTLTLEAARHTRRVLGVDGSDKMIAAAKRRSVDNVTFRQSTIEELGRHAPPPAGLVLCSSVLEYVDDLFGSLDVLARLVAPDGHLIVSMPNPVSLYRTAERVVFRLVKRPTYYRFVKNTMPFRRLAAELEARGLREVDFRTYGRGGEWLGRSLYVAVFVR